MKKVLIGLLALILATWAMAPTLYPSVPTTVWILRKELILLSGLASFVMMSLVMLLAVRPRWLERPLGGLDRMYRLHKWAGILAIGLALTHYLLDLSKDLLQLFFERGAKLPRAEGMLDMFRDVAKDAGEWSVWILGAMLVLTLWQRFPYHFWRYVHKVLALVYLALALHAVVLAPAVWWQQPVGWLIGLSALVGSSAALIALTGNIGRRRRYRGRIVQVERLVGDVLEVTCQVEGRWVHRPGQFAFVTFDRLEGAHPFTLSNADDGSGRLRFAIKALGDYTAALAGRLQVGQPVTVEGPYGRFDFHRDRADEQVWVAAGIGATPFLAWLESLQGQPQAAPKVTLHYCVRNPQEAVFAKRLRELCAGLPSVTLNIRYTERDGHLQADELLAANVGARPSIWFCGPQAFANALRTGLRSRGLPARLFHQEAFQMR